MTKPEKDGELRTCPFCGGKDPQLMEAPESWFRCRKCGAESPMRTSPEQTWNDAYCWKLLDQAEKKANAYREVAIGIVNRNMIADRTEPGEIAKDYSRPASRLIDAEAERILKGEL